MSVEQRGRMSLDYNPVALPGSALRFRGPQSKTAMPSVVCIGGSETFGRFIHAPFPAQLDTALPEQVLNLGVINAGLDVVTTDPAILAAVEIAEAIVFQITSAHNMSNRFYTVHPRRNDRFLTASATLRMIYPQVDFTEFNFTRHLLTHLHDASSDRFEIVRAELEAAWVARMIRFLNNTMAPVHLLWLSNRSIDASETDHDMIRDPLFVTDKMVQRVVGHAASLTIIAPDADTENGGTRGMFFSPQDAAAARLLPGPRMHDAATLALLEKLQ